MIIVAGTFRVPEDKIDAIAAVAQATLAATRKETGCIVYSYRVRRGGSRALRIYEEWESRAHLDAHLKQPHMGPWRAKLPRSARSEPQASRPLRGGAAATRALSDRR